jgi:hypothetical protein
MQTQQRKIPVSGADGKNKTWVELMPVYEKELLNFKRNIDSLKRPQMVAAKINVLKNADVIFPVNYQRYSLEAGKEIFVDTATFIKDYAEELKGLSGVKLSKSDQVKNGTSFKFTNAKPVKVLVGFFNSKDPRFLQPPQLETDASANDYGQADIKIANGLVISGMPPVNIHSYTFGAGTNTLQLGKGACLVLGFVEDSQVIRLYDAGLSSSGVKRELDWLFE